MVAVGPGQRKDAGAPARPRNAFSHLVWTRESGPGAAPRRSRMSPLPPDPIHGLDPRSPDPRLRARALGPRAHASSPRGDRWPRCWRGPASTPTCSAPRARGPALGAARRAAEAEARRAAAIGVRIVGRDEADYPAWLRRVYAPPPVLWVRGALVAGEGERAVAVVGSRAATALGLAFARALARDLAAAGVTVVSGLARGIDTAAHRGALDARGRTVAVLGSGLDRLYPPENAALARRDRGGRGRRERVPARHRPLEGELPAPQPRDRRLGAGDRRGRGRARAAAPSPPRGRRSTRGAR